MRGLDPRMHPFRKNLSKKMDGRVKPGHDDGKNFVNAMFTTFVRVRFTNVFDDMARIAAGPCVWRGCIAG
jgi:hypothetical protein